MSLFRIAAPFSDVRHVGKLHAAGATELYCGYVDAESEKKWPAAFYLINRRAKAANFDVFGHLKCALEEASRHRMPVYVTFNGLYTPEQYPWLLAAIERVSRLRGFTGLIISDIALLLMLRRMNYDRDICISTGGTTFNRYAIDNYRSLGATRVVLDRQLSAGEMKELAEGRDRAVDIELFVFHSGCMFVDGLCNFFHCQDPGESGMLGPDIELVRRHYVASDHHGGCQKIHDVLKNRRYSAWHNEKRAAVRRAYTPDKYPVGCNLCNLYLLKDAGGVTLKVVGRGEGRDKDKTVALVARAAGMLETPGLRYGAYRTEAKKIFRAITGHACSDYHCYCPAPIIGQGSDRWKKQS
jgi:hypothetical protein